MFNRLARVSLALAVVSLLSLVTPGSLTVATGKGAPPSCGGTALYKSDGSRWVCTFADEFTGTSLDTTKWTAWNNIDYLEYSNTCYYSDPSHVSVKNGYLNLSVTKLASPKQCPTPIGNITVQYGAGIVHSLSHFSQTYGRFEARIKFAGTDGLHDDFWLYPTANNYPGQAEIDIAEPFGAWSNTMFAATHVTGSTGQDVGGLGQCAIPNWANTFHTYAVVWTPTGIAFYYDGGFCYTYSAWTTIAGYTSPAPFNQSMFMILQTLMDSGGQDASTVLPSTMQVDYVHVWK